MAKRRTVLSIPIPTGGVEVADVLAVLTGVAPSYDLTRLELADGGEGPRLVLTAGRRRLRPGALIDAEPLPGLDEDEPVDPLAISVTLSHPPKPFPAVDEAGLLAGKYDEASNGQGEHAWAAAGAEG